MRQRKSILIPLVVLALLYVVSIVFFHNVEGWSYLDAAYFTTSTISTVGFGDIVPQTEYGKVGSIALIFIGVGLAFYIITHIGFIREKTVDPHVKRRLDILRNITVSSTLSKSQLNNIKKKLK